MKISTHIILLSAFFIIANISNAQIVIIEPDTSWNFYDNGDEPADQGSLKWYSQHYNDSAWSMGNAQLGYGDGDEATTINSNTDVAYFRKTFFIDNPAIYDNLLLDLIYDDGAVIYLNGVEVWRVNMPIGDINYTTFAASSSLDNALASTQIANILVEGNNTIAIEVHQSTLISSDISFNFILNASLQSLTTITRGPYLQSGSSNSITIKWRTNDSTESIIDYGLTLDSLNLSNINLTPSINHELKISDLDANTTYYYQIRNTNDTLVAKGSEVYFKTAPLPGTAQPITAWVLGDCGTANNNQRSVRDAYYNYIGNNHTDMMLFLGDNAYNTGTDSEYQYSLFENMYEDKLKNTVAWSCLGNHDGYSTNSINQTGPYYDIFTFPTNGEAGGIASGTEAYYSFDYGNIHFIVLESFQTNRAVGSPMYSWCLSDIQNTTQEWIVAIWHHPPYSNGSHNSDTETELIQMRQNFLPMLESNGVDLVLSGHSHSYERSYFLNGHYDNSSTFNSDIHTVGINGAGDGQLDGDGAYTKLNYGPTIGKGAAYITTGSSGHVSNVNHHNAMYAWLNKLGSVILEVDGDTMNCKFITNTGIIDDYFTITKGDILCGNDSIAGEFCDDNNACTINDQLNENCICIGTYSDIDNDGLCDAEDLCPEVKNSLIGTNCDDGNVCTTNDIYDTNCNCIGLTPTIITENIIGQDTALTDSIIQYSVIEHVGNIYEWTVSGGTFVTPNNTYLVEILWSNGSSGTVCVTELNKNCSGDEVCKDIVLMTTTNLYDLINIYNLRIYPNPTKDYVIVETNLIPDKIEVFDVTGKQLLVLTQGLNYKNKLDVSNFNSNVVLVKMTFKDTVITQKLFVD